MVIRRGLLGAAVLLLAGLGWLGWQGYGAQGALQSASVQLTAARAEVTAGHLVLAAGQARSAATQAEAAQDALGGWLFNLLRPAPWLGRQVQAAQSIASVAATLTRDGSDLLQVVAASPLGSGRGTTRPGLAELSALSVQLAPVQGPLRRSSAAVTAATATVARWQGASLVGPLSRALARLGPALTSLDKDLGVAQGLSDLVARGAQPGPPLRLLFLAQDTWELRPSGGYIGSYGIVEIGNGTLHLASYDDATTLPGPTALLHPPDPLGSNLQHPWTLTGAGWWPDFPTSARAAEQLYQLQGGGHVDGVLASTQQFLEDLVGALGTPVTVPGYPDVITSANISERILFNVELKRPLDSPRKKFLTLLTAELFHDLQSLSGDQATSGLRAFNTAFRARHLQIYLNDPTANAGFTRAGWTGALTAPAHSDVLALADADFGTDKATRYVRKHTTYTVSRTAQGRLVGQLDVTTTDFGASSELNRSYDSYLRVYAPPGTRLVDADQHTTDVRTGSEGGLVTYGVGQSVAPQSSSLLHFSYYLPDSVITRGSYRLLLRPQAGTPEDRITVTINLSRTPVSRTFLAIDGDQTLSVALEGNTAVGTRSGAPDRPWIVTPPAPDAPSAAQCTFITDPPAPLGEHPSRAQRLAARRARQAALQPQIDALQARGCQQVSVRYTQPAT